jgi:hypothetical protein
MLVGTMWRLRAFRLHGKRIRVSEALAHQVICVDKTVISKSGHVLANLELYHCSLRGKMDTSRKGELKKI